MCTLKIASVDSITITIIIHRESKQRVRCASYTYRSMHIALLPTHCSIFIMYYNHVSRLISVSVEKRRGIMYY